jgi:23S rRNA pseudouridine1911/1915/1917 synthase
MQFQNKTTHRLYRALAFGKFLSSSGRFDSYLARHHEDRKRVASTTEDKGKLAITHYRVLGYHQTGISLVELRLETGRTHQIRVHLSENGHPIVGDNTYGASKRLRGLKSVHLRKMIEELPRFALHAMELGFVHPRTKETMRFRAPWPSDLMPLIEHCEFPLYDLEHVVEIVPGI